MKSKDLRAQRTKLVEDARAILDAPDAGDEAHAKFDAMMVEADQLNAKIERIERADAEIFAAAEALRSRGEREGISADEAGDRQAREDDAFMAYIRGGFQAMTEAQRAVATPRFQAAQSTGTGSSGGYTIPDTLSRQIDDAMKAYGGMMDVAYVFSTASGNPLAIPTDNDTTHAGSILTENTQVSAQDVSFGSVTLGAYTYTSKLVLVSNQLLQ